VYQRKQKKDDWANVPIEPLSRLKSGECYQLELHAGELLPLLRKLGELYSLHRRQGVPRGREQYVRMERSLAQFLEMSETDLSTFLDSHQADALHTLHRVLRWLSGTSGLSDFLDTHGNEISVLNALLGAASLRSVLEIWRTNSVNADEDFWQKTFSAHAFVLSQLLAYPIVIIGEKAYVGGKRVDNRHGNLADFLAQAESTGNALVVELKTPTTALLGQEYRTDVFPPSRELGGAIAQALHYRDSLLSDIHALRQTPGGELLVAEPRSLVVIGNTAELDIDGKRASFERFRERLQGITVVTFDELFSKVEALAKLLGAADAT
jgi:hypothetical protein